jgi:hypothetical protein
MRVLPLARSMQYDPCIKPIASIHGNRLQSAHTNNEGKDTMTYTIGYHLFDGTTATMKRHGAQLSDIINYCERTFAGRKWIIKDQFNNALAFE